MPPFRHVSPYLLACCGLHCLLSNTVNMVRAVARSPSCSSNKQIRDIHHIHQHCYTDIIVLMPRCRGPVPRS